MSEETTEIADTELVKRTTVEYGIHDVLDHDEVFTLPHWHTPEDVLTEMHARGYTTFTREDIRVRTTTTTTTGWEAAS